VVTFTWAIGLFEPSTWRVLRRSCNRRRSGDSGQGRLRLCHARLECRFQAQCAALAEELGDQPVDRLPQKNELVIGLGQTTLPLFINAAGRSAYLNGGTARCLVAFLGFSRRVGIKARGPALSCMASKRHPSRTGRNPTKSHPKPKSRSWSCLATSKKLSTGSSSGTMSSTIPIGHSSSRSVV
jgi:hypothetical protein